MPRYDLNQTVVAFIRRLQADFGGFENQMISRGGEMVQILQGRMNYQNTKVSVTILPMRNKQDFVILSIFLFQLPHEETDELLQQLLSWNNGATETVHFSIDESQNTINLAWMREIEGMSFDEFQYSVNVMKSIAKSSVERLQREFGLVRA